MIWLMRLAWVRLRTGQYMKHTRQSICVRTWAPALPVEGGCTFERPRDQGGLATTTPIGRPCTFKIGCGLRIRSDAATGDGLDPNHYAALTILVKQAGRGLLPHSTGRHARRLRRGSRGPRRHACSIGVGCRASRRSGDGGANLY